MNKVLSMLFFVLLSFCSFGQKAGPQHTSVWAPGTIKIDGTSSEWNGKYEAFDKKNKLYYTISNDDKNLYLIVHTAEPTTINKIYVGGITFTISSVGQSKNIPVSITYPIIKAINNFSYLQAKDTYDKFKKNGIVNAENIKDLIRLKNQQFNSSYKELKANGIKEFDDPVMSIYNTEGIKVKALFDINLTYTYELALPLKYLQTILNSLDRLSYNIKFNGADRDGRNPYPQAHLIRPDGSEDMTHLYTENPTDFSGQYTLAKK